MTMRIGVDIGGTFTDFVVVDDSGAAMVWKEDSSRDDPAAAIARGLEALAERRGVGLPELLAATSLFVHGSTIATNALIERDGPTVGLLCTEGFRDVLYFRDGYKPERFNVRLPRPSDLVERHLRLPVRERVGVDGSVVVPLDEDGVRAAAERFRELGVRAIGVTFLWSIVNPDHERRAVEILREELPDVEVLSSADVLPEIREWERASATVLSAYILPRISTYLRGLERLLTDRGFGGTPLIMQINGGCAYVDEVLAKPVNTLASGPAAAPSAASYYFDQIGSSDVITVDMGGTSFDVCLIRDGRPAMSRTIQIEGQPIGVPGVEVQSIGAGGGSIAWIDSGGALRVGPQSAGASPGPAAYDMGGEHPTVTDANVVLGYLAPGAFLGGRRTLRDDLSATAIATHVGEPLGLDLIDAAAGIVKVVDANMVAGIRAVSVERGIDPRTFVLVSGGGAGGLHAARLARALEMPRVFIPEEASTFCAFGMTVTDVRHDYVTSLHGISNELAPSDLDEPLAELRGRALERLAQDGFAREDASLEFSVDARYPSQIHELTVVIPDAEHYADEDLRAIETAFHDHHERQFTYALRDLPVEFLHWRVTAIGHTSVRDAATSGATPHATGVPPASSMRQAYFEELGGLTDVSVHSAGELDVGSVVSGPAIVEAENTTVVVNPGDTLTVQPRNGFVIDVGAPLATSSSAAAALPAPAP